VSPREMLLRFTIRMGEGAAARQIAGIIGWID
jgi:hypothetical protein